MNEDDDVDMINLNTVKELQATIAERDATIERLRAALEEEQARTVCAACGKELAAMAAIPRAEVWEPMQPQAIACACRSGCKDNATLWSNAHLQVTNHATDRHADMILPPDVRLCRKVQL